MKKYATGTNFVSQSPSKSPIAFTLTISQTSLSLPLIMQILQIHSICSFHFLDRVQEHSKIQILNPMQYVCSFFFCLLYTQITPRVKPSGDQYFKRGKNVCLMSASDKAREQIKQRSALGRASDVLLMTCDNYTAELCS